MDIPKKYRVDTRVFQKQRNKTVTVSGYKKSNVVSAFKKALLAGDVARSIQWAIELHISNYVKELWKVFMNVVSKSIHRENPLLPIFMYRHYQSYLEQLTVKEPMNNQQCRNRITEITCVLALSHKSKLPVIKMKNKKIEASSASTAPTTEKSLLAPNSSFIEKIWKKGDLLEIKGVVNEFAYHIQRQDFTTDTQHTALYWLQWLFKWDKDNAKRIKKGEGKEKSRSFSCARRVNKYTDTKWATDYVWILWDILFFELSYKGLHHHENNQQIICQHLFRFFCSDYKLSSRTQKQIFLTHATLIVLNTYPKLKFTKPIYTHYDIVCQSVLNINYLYKRISDASKPHQSNRKRALQKERNEEQLASMDTQAQPPVSSSHPFFSYYMENQLYLDPTYNTIPDSHNKDDGLLSHLDKFFGPF